VHLVVDKRFLGGADAIMIPRTSDGRVLFGVPWHGRVILGTTDTPREHPELEPKALDEEIDFILRNAAACLTLPPQRSDILCVFAGLRPLAAPKQDAGKTRATKEISRSHLIVASPSGLVTITGGKYTTYRQMAEEAVNRAISHCALPHKACCTQTLKIHGHQLAGAGTGWRDVYGSDSGAIRALERQQPGYAEKLHEAFPFTVSEVVWAVRHEMAQTVDDVLARRVRALYLDARASIEMAPRVAQIMAAELNYGAEWVQAQTEAYTQIAQHYIAPAAPAGAANIPADAPAGDHL
jgi:glycerol-3-phosphate dehydrogenase